MRILVCDDDYAIRRSLTEGLKASGHDPASCESADAAIAMLGWVDAVVVDGLRGDWRKVVEAAYTLNKDALVFTGEDDIHDEASSMAIPVLLKPAGIAEILDALHAGVAA